MVCGEADNAADTLRLLPESQADLALVDISLPGNSGIDLIRDIQTLKPGFPIVVFSMHDETLYGERALRAGARGYVMKQDSPDRLLEAIRTVLAGHVFVGENLKDSLLSSIIVTNDHKRIGVERLSNRELQVFEHIGRGLSTAEIAAQLNLSPKTVETYRAHIKRKLGLKDGNHLLQAAIRWEESDYSGPTNQ